MKRTLVLILATSSLVSVTAAAAVPEVSSKAPIHGLAMLHHWNQIAVDMSGLDHTPLSPGEDRTFGEQIGPGRSSRAMAIVHIAIFDALNAIEGGYHGYMGLDRADRVTSAAAAIATAAHHTLTALFPSQSAACDAQLAADLGRLPHGRAQRNGIELGRRAAERILEMHSDDGSFHPEPLIGEG